MTRALHAAEYGQGQGAYYGGVNPVALAAAGAVVSAAATAAQAAADQQKNASKVQTWRALACKQCCLHARCVHAWHGMCGGTRLRLAA